MFLCSFLPLHLVCFSERLMINSISFFFQFHRFGMEHSVAVWWWSDPSCQWLSKVLDHIKTSNGLDKDQTFRKKFSLKYNFFILISPTIKLNFILLNNLLFASLIVS